MFDKNRLLLCQQSWSTNLRQPKSGTQRMHTEHSSTTQAQDCIIFSKSTLAYGFGSSAADAAAAVAVDAMRIAVAISPYHIAIDIDIE